MATKSNGETVVMPRWFWGLLIMATAWMTHQSVVVEGIRSVQSTIVAENQRRILRLESRVEELTERVARVETRAEVHQEL